VLQRDPAPIRPADVADDGAALDRIAANEAGDLGAGARRRIVEAAAALAVIEGDAPAVAMRAGLPAAPHQPGEAEADVGRGVRGHAQKLAHGRNRSLSAPGLRFPARSDFVAA